MPWTFAQRCSLREALARDTQADTVLRLGPHTGLTLGQAILDYPAALTWLLQLQAAGSLHPEVTRVCAWATRHVEPVDLLIAATSHLAPVLTGLDGPRRGGGAPGTAAALRTRSAFKLGAACLPAAATEPAYVPTPEWTHHLR